MEILALLRTVGALGVVLGLLGGALWLVRRYDLKLPGRTPGGRLNRLEIVERLSLEARRSLVLIRRDHQEHLILIGPEGATIVEKDISFARPVSRPNKSRSRATDSETLQEPVPAPSFGALVERLRPRGQRANDGLATNRKISINA